MSANFDRFPAPAWAKIATPWAAPPVYSANVLAQLGMDIDQFGVTGELRAAPSYFPELRWNARCGALPVAGGGYNSHGPGQIWAGVDEFKLVIGRTLPGSGRMWTNDGQLGTEFGQLLAEVGPNYDQCLANLGPCSTDFG